LSPFLKNDVIITIEGILPFRTLINIAHQTEKRRKLNTSAYIDTLFVNPIVTSNDCERLSVTLNLHWIICDSQQHQQTSNIEFSKSEQRLLGC
jgi:hypothetical protein